MGEIRTLKPGEFVQNPDGSRSTERTITVIHPKLNDGKPTNIPSIYSVDGEIVELGKQFSGGLLEDRAVDFALKSGQNFRSFPSIDEAVDFAIQRSNKGGAFQGQIGVSEDRFK